MSTSKPLTTSSESFRQLLSSDRSYVVPAFQRDYSWEEEQWQDLWHDLVAIENGDSHYIGYAVFQDVGNEHFNIIDGQQRFATLTILVLAALKVLEEWSDNGIEAGENRERIEVLRGKFIGTKSGASLTTVPKLTLNKNNDDFFQSYIIRLREPVSKSRLKPSQQLLWKAFAYFHREISKLFERDQSGAKLAEFIEKRVGNSLVFTTIQVADDQSAFKVFETLNARGVKLSSTDLLKNYLFSVVHRSSPSDLREVERQWQSINNILGDEDFTTFLRHYWNSKNPLSRKSGLFRDIKRGVTNDKQAFQLLADLEAVAPFYVALSHSEDSLWRPEERLLIDALTLLGVSQCYSLLFAARETWSDDRFIGILKLCVVVSFRYQTIGGLNPNTLEERYGPAAIAIRKGEIENCREAFNALRDVYPSDEKFKSDFAMKSLTSGSRAKKLVRYILRNLEADAVSQSAEMGSMAESIEHILPENASEIWDEYFAKDEQEAFSARLGNLCLLEPAFNREAADKSFTEKLCVYRKSRFATTRAIADFGEWTPTTLRSRQEQQAERAAHVWRVDYSG